jgi:hypothetical protein
LAVKSIQQIYIIKELVQPKKSLNHRKFLIWKKRGRGERERGRERCGQAGGHVSRHAAIFKVMLGMGYIKR